PCREDRRGTVVRLDYGLWFCFIHASHSDGRGDLDSWSSGKTPVGALDYRLVECRGAGQLVCSHCLTLHGSGAMSGGQAWDRSSARLRLVVVFVHASHSDGRGDLDSSSSGLSSREPVLIFGRSALCRLWSAALAVCGGCFLPPKPIAIHQGPSAPSLLTWPPRTAPHLRKDHLKGPHRAVTLNEVSSSSLAACFRTGALILLRWTTMDITEQQVRPLSGVTYSVTSSRDFRAALRILTAVPKPSWTTRPTIKRRVNYLASQRTSERITPPVMRIRQGAFPGTIYQRYARSP
ncbi:hypothetical protein Taro_010004, partial [Colocasia esculenta]|nr:hypothetical protein [Colocasia esculenta]